jgi:crotonobetainyl-CoA:carnitine CoA-transferase CaiB-like acyl-CoA transferase
MIEPILDMDEVLESDLVREREMVVEIDQPGAGRPVRQLGVPVKMSRTPGAPQGPGPELGEHTDEVLAAAGYSPEEIEALKESGAAAGPATGVPGSFMA